MASPLVSVIVPTYNRAYCLPRTLDSVLAQTHTNYEVIIVDDGSSDSTGDMVARTYGHDSRIKYFFQENKGVTAARNQGLARVQGDYVALLDSDDVWMPWKLELQLACFRRCPEVGMVWTDMQAVGPDGKVVSNAYLRTMYHAYRWFKEADLFPHSYSLSEAAFPGELAETRLHVGDIFSQMIMGNLVHTSTVLLSRERFEQVRRFNEDLVGTGEDYDFHLRTCRGGPVGFADVASIRYQTGVPDQLTSGTYRLHIAVNCLATIQPILEHERARIHLPRSMIRARLAEVHGWVGDELLESGQPKKARGHLLKSLWHRPLQPRTMALLFLASLPGGGSNVARRCWRWLKKTPRRSKSVEVTTEQPTGI
jgi:GT2 family glycosyltransferase